MSKEGLTVKVLVDDASGQVEDNSNIKALPVVAPLGYRVTCGGGDPMVVVSVTKPHKRRVHSWLQGARLPEVERHAI